MKFIDNLFKKLNKLLSEYFNDNSEVVRFEIKCTKEDKKIVDLMHILNEGRVKTAYDTEKNVLCFSLEGLKYSYNEKYNELTFRWIIPIKEDKC